MARPREFDEPTVLAAAERVFWSTGYQGTSIDDVTKLTGLGKAACTAHMETTPAVPARL